MDPSPNGAWRPGLSFPTSAVNDYAPATWRVIRSTAAGGPTNMAVDEAILRSVAAGKAPPTLRFYAWQPPTLSLGRAQPASDVDLPALEAAGFGLVRRPTGGKAILHVDELTYSVVAPEREPRVAGTIVESYYRLSRALVWGLERLGVAGAAADARAMDRAHEGPVCFEVPSDYEVTAGRRKLIGSAQMRSDGAVLQHGTVPLTGDIARICRVLAARPDPDRVRARATTVEEALGRTVTWDQTVEAISLGFSEVLNLRLVAGDLTVDEQFEAEQLRVTKYGQAAWTLRV